MRVVGVQRWLKRITPDRYTLEKLWCLRPFKALVLDRGCWTFSRHSVTRAFALGLFIAFIPPTPLPVHLVTCVILGVMFRLNLPVLFATVFLSNPFTWLPQVVGSIWVGTKLMGVDFLPLLHDLKHRHLGAQVHQLWAPLLLGALVLGLIAAGTGYVLAQCAWRVRVIYLLRRRRARSNGRRTSLD
ncbi:MAG: DUF2062 domain-containing protein [Steroidobacteraceae bacterium]